MVFCDGQTSHFEHFMSAASVCIESSETTWYVLSAHGLAVALAHAHGISVLVVELFRTCVYQFKTTALQQDVDSGLTSNSVGKATLFILLGNDWRCFLPAARACTSHLHLLLRISDCKSVRDERGHGCWRHNSTSLWFNATLFTIAVPLSQQQLLCVLFLLELPLS